jgi:hypothetical protein
MGADVSCCSTDGSAAPPLSQDAADHDLDPDPEPEPKQPEPEPEPSEPEPSEPEPEPHAAEPEPDEGALTREDSHVPREPVRGTFLVEPVPLDPVIMEAARRKVAKQAEALQQQSSTRRFSCGGCCGKPEANEDVKRARKGRSKVAGEKILP